MKKALTLLLVFLLSLSVFVACDFGQKPEQEQQQGGETKPPVVDEDLQAAYDYIKLTYKTLSTTATNFEVMKNAPVGEKMFAITWTTNNEAITITETEDGKFYVVNVPALGEASIAYTLNFSIQNDKGEKKEGSFNLTVPAYQVNTFDEYAAAEDGTSLTVQGIVTGVISKSTNSTKENSLFLQDLNNNGGYYIYNLAEDPAGTISVGMTVEVKGEKKNYNGTFELVNPVVTVIDQTIKTVTPVDYTEIFAAAASTDAAELIAKQGMLVSINGVTLLNYTESDGYHNFELGNNKSYLRVSSSSNCITKEEGKTVTETFKANFYNSATVTGIIAVFNGGFYLMPVSSAPFTGFVEQEKPTDVKINIALENTKIPSIIQVAGDTALPTTFAGWTDLSITWEITEGDAATLSGNTLTVATVPTEAKTVALKATFTCGEVTDTKDYTVIVKPISTITIKEANNIGDNMAHNTYTEELYYIVGTVDSVANTQYGNLYIVDGDFTIYVYGTYDSTGKVRYDAMDPQPLKKDTIKVLSTIGKYNNDVQLKNAKVVEHTVHPDNVVNDEPIDDSFVPVRVDTPVLGTAYKFALNQATVGKFVYFNGTTNGFLGTSEKYTEGVDVTIKAVAGRDGAYTISFMDGTTEKFVEIYLNSDNKARIRIETTATNYYTYDANLGVYVATFGTKSYYIGTYDTFTTFSASGTNYIANEGNFTAWFYTMVDTSAVSDADKVAIEKNALSIKTDFSSNETLTLPANGTNYTDVAITWTVDGVAATELAIVVGDVAQEIKLVATIKSGEVELTKEFTVTVDSKAAIEKAALNITTSFTADGTLELPTAGTTYTDVVISWADAEGDAVTGPVTITQTDDAQEIKLVATIVSGNTTETKEFTVTVSAKSNEGESKVLETFEFGADGETGHVDGFDIGATKTYEGSNGYDLVITNASKVYDGGKDETGKSFLKLGTSSVVGTFTFTVADDVDTVVIKVAGYKAKTSKYTINGGDAVTVTTSSNNGEYTEVTIDTTTTKTITFATVSSACRLVIDSITFIG